jgi:hypothetical protein
VRGFRRASEQEVVLAFLRGEIFEGFPEVVDWYYGVLQPDQLSRIRFIEYSYWNELSGGSRRQSTFAPPSDQGRCPPGSKTSEPTGVPSSRRNWRGRTPWTISS